MFWFSRVFKDDPHNWYLLSLLSFSRGHRCKRRGPPFQATTLPFGPRLRPPQQRSTPPISPSWWPWLPCPSIPHRHLSTTSLRSDSTRLQTGITLHLLYLDCVFTSGCFNVLDYVCCVVDVQIWLLSFVRLIYICLSCVILQYRHSAPPYVGPPQQYPVQPTGPSTFYAGPSPGDFPAPYGELLPALLATCGLLLTFSCSLLTWIELMFTVLMLYSPHF